MAILSFIEEATMDAPQAFAMQGALAGEHNAIGVVTDFQQESGEGLTFFCNTEDAMCARRP